MPRQRAAPPTLPTIILAVKLRNVAPFRPPMRPQTQHRNSKSCRFGCVFLFVRTSYQCVVGAELLFMNVPAYMDHLSPLLIPARYTLRCIKVPF